MKSIFAIYRAKGEVVQGEMRVKEGTRPWGFCKTLVGCLDFLIIAMGSYGRFNMFCFFFNFKDNVP